MSHLAKVTTGQNIVVIEAAEPWGCETAEFAGPPGKMTASPNGKHVTVREMMDNLMKEDRSYARSSWYGGCRKRVRDPGGYQMESVKGTLSPTPTRGRASRLPGVDTWCAPWACGPSNEPAGAGADRIPVYTAGSAEDWPDRRGDHQGEALGAGTSRDLGSYGWGRSAGGRICFIGMKVPPPVRDPAPSCLRPFSIL